MDIARQKPVPESAPEARKPAIRRVVNITTARRAAKEIVWEMP